MRRPKLFLLNSLNRRSVQLLLLAVDGLLFFCSIWMIYSLRFLDEDYLATPLLLVKDVRFWTILFFLYFSYYIFDLYEPRGWRRFVSSPLRLLLASCSTLLLVFAWLFFSAQEESGIYGRGVLLGAVAVFSLTSYLIRKSIQRQLQREVDRNRFLLISSAEWADRFEDEFKKKDSGGNFEWVQLSDIEDSPNLLAQKLRERWTAVVVESDIPSSLLRKIMKYRLDGIRIISFTDFYEVYWAKIPVHTLDDSWFAFTEGFNLLHNRVNARLKRVVDILLSITLLILLLPVAAVLWIAIKLESKGPAIYKQYRVGQDGKTFKIYKFRSMAQNCEKNGAQWASQNDCRITRIGKFIRLVRLDETPQLINILRGQMSFIGPRPERPEFTHNLEKEIPFYELRHLVKPGLTGWAQVMYPYGASVEDAREKLEYELYYIKNQSVELDLKIVAKTVAVVCFGAGR